MKILQYGRTAFGKKLQDVSRFEEQILVLEELTAITDPFDSEPGC